MLLEDLFAETAVCPDLWVLFEDLFVTTVEGLLVLLSLCTLRCCVADRLTVVLTDLRLSVATVPCLDCVEVTVLLLAAELVVVTGVFLLPGPVLDLA